MDVKNSCLCSWSSDDIEKNLNDFRDLVRTPEYICKGCGRASSTKESLCDPVPVNEDN